MKKPRLIQILDSTHHINTHDFKNNAKLVRENEQLKHMLGKCNEFRAIENLMKENTDLKIQIQKLKK